jgi:hypothetical protein
MLSPFTDSGFQGQSSPQSSDTEVQKLRVLVQRMQDRERRLMDLLNASAPDRIEHDLRNVLNELVLLRALLDPKSIG